MNQEQIILYGHTTTSDIDFMETDPLSFPSTSSAANIDSTMSDAQSAPPELERVFDRICDEYAECVLKAGKQLPPEWTMPDLVRTVVGEEPTSIPGFLTHSYYDLMLHGSNSWLCQELFEFLDLINYVF
ncbi:unnamed protein product [Coffea canephora]|uniref:DH200=94 genomic scaffold, scaffold_159 n=1 Tax=Coffea canephora TaxID=49390 RepID=A0A068V9R0_COFCA|nr:unnamed protein product [Coffea canephora]